MANSGKESSKAEESDTVTFCFSIPLNTPSAVADNASGSALDGARLDVYGYEVEYVGDELDMQSPWNVISRLSPYDDNPYIPSDFSLWFIERYAGNLFRMSEQGGSIPDSEE